GLNVQAQWPRGPLRLEVMKRNYVAAVHCLVRQLVLITLDDYAGKNSAPGLLVSSDHRAYAAARSKTTPTTRVVQISFVVSGRSSSLSRFFNATSFGLTNIQKPRSIVTAAPQMKMNRSIRASGDRFSPPSNFRYQRRREAPSAGPMMLQDVERN